MSGGELQPRGGGSGPLNWLTGHADDWNGWSEAGPPVGHPNDPSQLEESEDG